MRAMLNKWGRRLVWLPAVVLVLYGVVQTADYCWFRATVPIGFQANWSGTWSSVPAGGYDGRLLVHLPDPLPENQDFRAEVLVYYPIYFGFRTGRFTKFDFTGHFSPDNPSTAGSTPKRAPSAGDAAQEYYSKGGKIKFKGVFEEQAVEYSALIDPMRTRMVGGYLSKWPFDSGVFSIRYY